MKRLVGLLLLGCIVLGAGCASGSGGGGSSSSQDGAKTYDQLVREIGRPPNRTVSSPDGSRQATWETNVQGGVRHFTVTFDPSGKMTGHSTSVKPRRRR